MTDIINTIKDEELKTALTQLRTKKRGRPKKSVNVNGTPDNHTKVCLNVPVEKINKIREIAYLDTRMMKDLIEEGLDYVIEKYEATHGTVIPNTNHHINIRKQ